MYVRAPSHSLFVFASAPAAALRNACCRGPGGRLRRRSATGRPRVSARTVWLCLPYVILERRGLLLCDFCHGGASSRPCGITEKQSRLLNALAQLQACGSSCESAASNARSITVISALAAHLKLRRQHATSRLETSTSTSLSVCDCCCTTCCVCTLCDALKHALTAEDKAAVEAEMAAAAATYIL